MSERLPSRFASQWADRTVGQRTGLLFMAGGGGLLVLSLAVGLVTARGPAGRGGVGPLIPRSESSAESRPANGPGPAWTRPGDTHPRTFRIGGDLLTGPLPIDEKSMESVSALGARTILSVDGAACDAEAARRHGMRVVHAPIGFDGIADAQRRVLLKGVRDLERPLYVCSSDATQRPPAAVAFALVGLGRMSGDAAVAMMRELGTDARLKGLFTDVMAAKPVEPAALDMMEVVFVERARVSPWTQSMVELGRAADSLSEQTGLEKNAADMDGIRELVLRIGDRLAGLPGTPLPAGMEPGVGDELQAAIDAARRLAEITGDPSGDGAIEVGGRDQIRTRLIELIRRCDGCHAKHRN